MQSTRHQTVQGKKILCIVLTISVSLRLLKTKFIFNTKSVISFKSKNNSSNRKGREKITSRQEVHGDDKRKMLSHRIPREFLSQQTECPLQQVTQVENKVRPRPFQTRQPGSFSYSITTDKPPQRRNKSKFQEKERVTFSITVILRR